MHITHREKPEQNQTKKPQVNSFQLIVVNCILICTWTELERLKHQAICGYTERSYHGNGFTHRTLSLGSYSQQSASVIQVKIKYKSMATNFQKQ